MLQAAPDGIIAGMGTPSEVKILIRAERQASGRRWAEMLRPCGARVWLEPGEMPPDEQPEVILTDRDDLPDQSPAQSKTESPPSIVGVIRIGPRETDGTDAADLRLPEDVTARELQVACRLLAQIVRLRRRQRSGADLHRRLAQQAMTDPLTGLPNRRAWDRAIRERLAAAGGSRRLCLAILDLDHFKRVNDAQGHAVGDEVLRASGRAVRQCLRQGDFVARLGGDEFGLLLWVPDESAAAAAVDRVRAALPSRLAEAGTHVLTASAGYDLTTAGDLPLPPPSPAALYAAADAGLRAAKRQGRDRTVRG